MKFYELLGAAFNSWYVECSNGLIALAEAGGDPDKVNWEEVSQAQPVGWKPNYEAEELRDVTVSWVDGVLKGDPDQAGVYIDTPDTVKGWEARPSTREDAYADVLKARDFFNSGVWV